VWLPTSVNSADVPHNFDAQNVGDLPAQRHVPVPFFLGFGFAPRG
jgi:hypothetical protein